MPIVSDVLQAIGNTALVALRRVVPAGCARILVKIEGQNPTGSMKDRMALAMIGRPRDDGRLAPGGTVVEYTGGTTGASLALVCTAMGHRLKIVSSDAFSEEKLAQMHAFGAELTIIKSDNKKITRELILAMIEEAKEIASRHGAYWTDQLNNRDSIHGYVPMGEEIWDQTEGRVDGFVQSIGTSASLQGVVGVIRARNPALRVIAVEPAESAVLSGGAPGSHRIEGIGIGYTPPMWRADLVHEVVPIASADGEAMARRLAREEGLFSGTSSGANVLAAIRLGLELGPGATVVTLLVDNGLKYVSTEIYRRT